MKFKRLLTVGLMALLCAGTAMAASQLNSLQVTPGANNATVNLRTTGSFAHKEYRPDAHLVLIDLTGVTAEPSVERTAALTSAVLKSYKLSSYTSASGSEVTRIELALGDGVGVEVIDRSDGLQILLSGGGSSVTVTSPAVSSVAGSFPSASVAKTITAPMPAVAAAVEPSRSSAESAAPVTKNPGPQQTAQVAAPVRPAVVERPVQSPASATLTTIRAISVQRGHGTLDIVIEGPNAAQPFLLKNPDRLVVDFNNAVVRPSVRNIAVHTKDVLQVRVGRFQADPPVTRIVIDLGGPRSFDVVPSAKQVIVRVNTEDTGMLAPPLKAAPVPALASVEVPAVAGRAKPVGSSSQNDHATGAALASASPKAPADVPAPAVNSASQSRPALKAAPAPVVASVEAPAVVKQTKPTSSNSQKDHAAGAALASASPKASADVPPPAVDSASQSRPALKAAPAPVVASVEAPAVVEQTKPTSSNSQKDHATGVALASAAPKASADVPPPAVNSASQSSSALKAAPAPAVASVEAPAVVERTKPTNLNSQNDHAPRAALAIASLKAPADPFPAEANSASQTTSQRIRDPRLRAGAAAETMASSPQVGQAPAEMASRAAASSTPRYTGEPISVNLKDVDLKDFFRLIHEISGLNIVLDPNVKGTVTLVLDDVPWDQALDIVLKNNALDRELQGNVLRIAASDTLRREAVDRRAQSEAVALAVDRQTITRFISYAKAKDIVPTVKKFLTARGDVISDDRTNALIISDIPSVLPNLDRLISQLDRKSQEVEIEVRVVSATRSFSRDLGFQLGFNWANGVSTIGGSSPNGAAISSTSGSTSSTTSTIPLFTNLPAAGATTGLSLSNITKTYGIDAILTAAETHNLAKVLSRPRVVTQSNVKAEVKQGVKIPVYTSGTANANSSVSYVDAVLRLSVVPQITSDNTIFLTVDVENTQPSGTINGNYILSTQQATTQVLVTDGGTVVIGGVIQTTNTVSTTQTPILGDIPWLGNLFKERLVKTETDELIFFITPKIIQT
jgi:type IV pilus secretin PilQ/predicted competence protein